MNVKKPYTCPHCNAKLLPWRSPDMTSWGGDIQYICFNDECPYFKGGWNVMESIGNECSYRFMYDPDSGGCHPIPVPSKEALREYIADAT